MEDYKEKYENALAKIKQIFDKGSKFVIRREVFESIFPELRESEDEKIRKEIINYFECQSRDEPERKGIHNRWIDWIEKQGEENFTDNKEKLDLLNFIRKETGCGLAEANNALLKLIKVLKQHPFPIMDKPRKLKIEWEE